MGWELSLSPKDVLLLFVFKNRATIWGSLTPKFGIVKTLTHHDKHFDKSIVAVSRRVEALWNQWMSIRYSGNTSRLTFSPTRWSKIGRLSENYHWRTGGQPSPPPHWISCLLRCYLDNARYLKSTDDKKCAWWVCLLKYVTSKLLSPRSEESVILFGTLQSHDLIVCVSVYLNNYCYRYRFSHQDSLPWQLIVVYWTI